MIYQQAFEAGVPFQRFLATVAENRDMWHAMAARASVSRDVVDQVRGAPGRWRLLVIAEDWCGDAVNILPVVARLAEESGRLDLRIVGRDAKPGLMDHHLTNGNRSIPVVILLDETGVCRGWWGPRPAELQALFERDIRPLPKEDRYPRLRRWYARDGGRAIALEIAEMVLCAATRAAGHCTNVRPCRELKAA